MSQEFAHVIGCPVNSITRAGVVGVAGMTGLFACSFVRECALARNARRRGLS